MCAAFGAALDSSSESKPEPTSTDTSSPETTSSEPPARGLSGLMRTVYLKNAKAAESNPRPVPKRGFSGLVYGAWQRRKSTFLRQALGIKDHQLREALGKNNSPWTKANQ
tara:strand:- start:260 stop:589 length:330 start_codon:yes stop_codon:yes gene_type:complete